MSNIIIRRNRDLYIKAKSGVIPFDLEDIFAVYALEKINPSYTGNLMTVRRTIDNEEETFGFNQWNDILNFVGSSDGRITELFEQINGRNVIQTSGGAQPFIVRNGVLTTDSNNNPAIDFGSENTFLERDEFFPTIPITAFSISQADDVDVGFQTIFSAGILTSSNGYGHFYQQAFPFNKSSQVRNPSTTIQIEPLEIGESTLITSVFDNPHITSSDNGSEISVPFTGGNITPNRQFGIGARDQAGGNFGFFLNGKVTALLLYNGVKGNRTTINQQLINKYGI